jgi:hypothetical protein
MLNKDFSVLLDKYKITNLARGKAQEALAEEKKQNKDLRAGMWVGSLGLWEEKSGVLGYLMFGIFKLNGRLILTIILNIFVYLNAEEYF